jgi:hypothetical protein
MNSASKPNPTGENSRRNFLEKIGALAAASGVAANASASPQQPPQPQPGAAGPGMGGRGGNSQPVPGPLSKEPMPTVRFGKYDISRVIIGSNVVAGLSHLSRMIDVEIRAWNTPESLARQFKRCEELGINCMEDGMGRIPPYNKEYGGKLMFATRNTASKDESLKPGRGAAEIAKGGCIAIHHGGAGDTGTDAWWRRGKLDRVKEWCKPVRDAGVLVAITSHRPEVFDIIESQGNWDVDYYMCCMYKYGRTKAEWEKAFASCPGMAPAEADTWADNPGTQYYGDGSLFVRGDPEEMLKMVRQTKKPCWVYKILAGGRLCESPQIVEATFKHVFASIKSTDAVVVGMWDKTLDQFAINKEYIIKYGGTSIKNGGTATSA